MKPSQVLDMHADLASRCDDWRFNQVMYNGYTQDLGVGTSALALGRTREIENSGRHLAKSFTNHVRAAHTYQVTEDMTDLVTFAASQLDAEDTFDSSLAPTGCGIVRFDKPLLVKDVRGKIMKAHWLVWGPTASGAGNPVTQMTWFNDVHDPDEISTEDLWDNDAAMEILGRWRWIGGEYRMNGAPLGDEDFEMSTAAKIDLWAEGVDPVPATNLVRYAHALWLLLNQTIAAKDEPEIERSTRRRMAKAKLPSKVTVISLRRTKHAQSDGESQVHWGHRWFVRGHWRWQSCGENYLGAQEQSPGVYRARIWINGFVKGPEGAPIIQSAKVYQLNR